MARSQTLHEILRLWTPVAVYVLIIAWLAVQKSVPVPAFFPPEYNYIIHILEYSGLGILTARALNGGLTRHVPTRQLYTAFLLCLLFASADEIFQWLFSESRFGDYMDVLSDGVGLGLGLGALHLWQRVFLKNRTA